ncbi:hypothetical protein WA026_022755 [Henosepilachna vigintioctopunctata]|uniref:Uncharacterized protein n=1 Tax=Henosepilachna vigintioctopunctata TaxID=420089 RepID=A0AAW1UT61_9CUCU
MDSDEEALLLLLLLRRRRRRRRQTRKFWVHPILQLREQHGHGQFHHLFVELRSDEEKFFFRSSRPPCSKNSRQMRRDRRHVVAKGGEREVGELSTALAQSTARAVGVCLAIARERSTARWNFIMQLTA